MAMGPGGAKVGNAPDGTPGRRHRALRELGPDPDRFLGAGRGRRADAPDSARLTTEQLRADPARYLGQPVTWRLQFLSVQTADELRPELPPGMPYLLTRGPLPEAGFVTWR